MSPSDAVEGIISVVLFVVVAALLIGLVCLPTIIVYWLLGMTGTAAIVVVVVATCAILGCLIAAAFMSD